MKRIMATFSARGLGFYLDCVQLAIGERGRVTPHTSGSTTYKKQKHLSRRDKYQSGLNRGEICIRHP